MSTNAITPTVSTLVYMGSLNPPHHNHTDCVGEGLELATQVAIMPRVTNPKKKLAPLEVRAELMDILVKDVFTPKQQENIIITQRPKGIEAQQALLQQLGDTAGILQEFVSDEAVLPFLEQYANNPDKLHPELKNFFYHIIERPQYTSTQPRLNQLLAQLGIKYQYYQFAELKPLSSTQIRAWLKAENWTEIAKIYPQKAINFLRQHHTAFIQ